MARLGCALRKLLLVMLILVVATAAVYLSLRSSGGGNVTTTVVLRGSGATFPAAQYVKWFNAFREKYGIVVEYRPVGSGQGIQDFLNGLVDFAGTDPPLPHDKWLEARKKYGGVIQTPAVAGAIVVVYNIPELPRDIHLNLTGDVLAKIYMGVIRYWDDPEIQALNPAVKLPHREIRPVYRADASGTTQYFTYYLSLSSREWREKYGYSKVWPVQGVGIGARGNQGVAATVKSTPYSIGYVEWAYAIRENLAIAAISPPGRRVFLLPSIDSAKRTLEAVAEVLPRVMDDWSTTFGATINASIEAAGYPLIAYTHLVFRKNYDSSKCSAIRQLLEWLYKANVNQIDIVEGYIPLPEPLAKKLLEARDAICKA